MDNYNISVVVPCHNLENFIKALLTSLKAQDLGGYTAEYIFVLDACEDNTEEVIKASGLKCTILKADYHSCGLSRNLGMDFATGEYIWFMDGDDWIIGNDAIKTALDFAYQNKANIIRVEFDHTKYYWAYFSMVWQYLFKRSFVKNIYFDERQPAEDDRWMKRVLGKVGLDDRTYMTLPSILKPLYYYNYGREGSNMMLYWEEQNKGK